MRIFDQIEQLVKSAKSAKSLTIIANASSINELLIMGKDSANYAEFQALMNYLSKKLAFNLDDFNAWDDDFEEDELTTLYCLRLMKNAVSLGKTPDYGWLL